MGQKEIVESLAVAGLVLGVAAQGLKMTGWKEKVMDTNKVRTVMEAAQHRNAFVKLNKEETCPIEKANYTMLITDLDTEIDRLIKELNPNEFMLLKLVLDI